MEVAAIILAALIIVGGILYVHHGLSGGGEDGDTSASGEATGETATVASGEEPASGEVCCGQHYSCERDSLLTAMSSKVEYYDDEELDRYQGRGAEEYDKEEVEEFRDVLLTLRPDDLAGWGRSIQLRGINLPAEIRDEFLLLIDEMRSSKATTPA